jgi:hypothetical protein
MAKKEKTQAIEPETPFIQKLTIRDAVTYNVDEQGNEIKKTDTETQGHGDTEK